MNSNLYQLEITKKKISYNLSPTVLFNHLCGKKKATLLLESAEINTKNAIESMIISDSALKIIANNNVVTIEALSKNGAHVINLLKKHLSPKIKILEHLKKLVLFFPVFKQEMDEDQKLFYVSVFDVFRSLFKIIENPQEVQKGIFLGGMFSYDLINYFEKLPKICHTQKCPDFCFYLAEVLITLDHRNKSCVIQSSLFYQDNGEKLRLKQRMKNIEKKLLQPIHPIIYERFNDVQVTNNITDLEYVNIIKKMQKKIYEGVIYQIVPSRRFFLPCPSPLAAYDQLKKNNPSPYMFFMQDTNFTLFGASPESFLKYDPDSRKIEIYPIAGTRSRGFNDKGEIDYDLDSRIELEMRTDQKELSEHLMLVDLARNDLAKICVPGSRYVEELTKVDRYSHVMHLVSKVTGILRKDLDIFHAYRACMNMGTLSGAPKVAAMQLISIIEKEKRGSYGGSMGYMTASGIFDTCIIIRSAYVEKDIATIQSGAGIVLDSDPQSEVIESKNKAQAVINAIISAHRLSSLRVN